MLPDGSYRMSLNSAAEAVDLSRQNASDFLRSNTAKRLLGKGYTRPILDIEVESRPSQVRGQTRIRALPLGVVTKYWLWQSFRGNKKAFVLVDALLEESLERRFDTVFNVQRGERYYDERLAKRVEQLEQQAGEAFAAADDERRNAEMLEQQIRELGGKPYWELNSDSE